MKKKTRHPKPHHAHGTFEGRIDINRSGRGFVTLPTHARDIEIPFAHLNTAMNGDKVRIVLIQGRQAGGRLQGSVQEVLSRLQTDFLGRVVIKRNKLWAQVQAKSALPLFEIEGAEVLQLQDNDWVKVRLKCWTSTQGPTCAVLEKCSHWSTTQIQYQQILLAHGFSHEFPPAVKESAQYLAEHLDANAEELPREDFRKKNTITIDPDDAKDFDDAISFEDLGDGVYEIGVHIADVSHYIKPGDAIDQEAYRLATSVYLPGDVKPMLPEILSNHICSLVPNEDRKCYAAIFKINAEAKIIQYHFAKTLIHSKRRFTYAEAQKRIETQEGDFAQEVHILNSIAKKLRSLRMQQGSVDFESTEVKLILDKELKPLRAELKKAQEANQLVEEYMLLANKYVAQFINAKFKQQSHFLPNRIHDQPDEIKLQSFARLAKIKGFDTHLKLDASLPAQLNKLIHIMRASPSSKILQSYLVRCMAKAEYSTQNIGHYGLGFDDYCHFTSPIRRYPDIMTHRVLTACLLNKEIDNKKINQQCQHCSERERSAMQSEREATQYKLCEMMQEQVGRKFKGVISGIAKHGFWVELQQQFVEGFVSIDTLDRKEHFYYDENTFAIQNRKGNIRYQIGDIVDVKLENCDLEERKLNFSISE